MADCSRIGDQSDEADIQSNSSVSRTGSSDIHRDRSSPFRPRKNDAFEHYIKNRSIYIIFVTIITFENHNFADI